MQHILVTGGAGFIGTNLTERLVSCGMRVTVIDRLDKPRQVRNAQDLAGASMLPHDLLDRDLRRVLTDVDTVVHLAGRPGVQTSWGSGFRDHLRDNVDATQRLLEAALDSTVERIVLASSSSVYGENPGRPSAEVDRLAPSSPYGASKAAMELLAAAYADRGLPITILRYFSVYGRRQRPDMALHRILRAGLGGPAFTLRGDGSQRRDLTHVDDVIDATVAAARATDLPAGTTINVGHGRPVGLQQVIDLAGAVLGRSIPVTAVSARPGDVATTAADTDRCRRLLGTTAQVALADGIADQLRHISRQLLRS